MKYYIYFFIGIPFSIFSQTIINQGDAKVTLHINPDQSVSRAEGLIVPQMSVSELNQKENIYTQMQSGAIIYINNLDAIPTTKNQKIRKKGYYFFNGIEWRVFVEDQKKIFNLPYFITNQSIIQTGQQLDLYELYTNQFTKEPSNQFLSNNINLQNINQIYSRDQLDYVITYYDTKTIQINSLTANGILNYDITSTDFDLSSFINVVLVVK